MIVLPAIDLIDHAPVRLKQGDYTTAFRVADSAEEAALRFRKEGASWIHVVDLDGAKAGCSVNFDTVQKIKEVSGLAVEVGGGIRTMKQIEDYMDSGIERIILGTAAVENEELLKESLQKYGERIAVGIDALNGIVKTAGWLSDTNLDCISFAQKMESIGVRHVIVTDISKDGMMKGPSFELYRKLQESVTMEITASGGIGTMQDLIELADMDLYGAITGKAVYAGSVDLCKAVTLCGGKR